MNFFIFPSTSSYLNVHGNTRSRSGNTFFSTEILGYFSETDFCLISADEFRSRVDGNTRFCSRNTFFLVSSIYRTLSALAIQLLQDR